MNILVLGSGGREHALAWKMAKSELCTQVFIAPGNAGTALVGKNIAISPTDFSAVKKTTLEHQIGLVVVGPEDPLVKGIYDFFKSDDELKNIPILAPSGFAAQLEGSKAFAKAFMNRHNIPTATYREFTADSLQEGIAFIKTLPLPIVLKADGLAAGKGVLICQHHDEAVAEFEQMVVHAKFGAASKKVVIESFLKGIEVSVFVLTDGKDFVILPEAKDYKRVGVGDSGLNTGGMGAVSPVPFFDQALKDKILERIVKPTIAGFALENIEYRGFVFLGLMIDDGEPFVIEYNCRMGDPETEVVLPRIESDLVEMLLSAAQGRLADAKIKFSEKAAATTILVSGGYPGSYETGMVIEGLTEEANENELVFHAGTKVADGVVLTHGGRVLAITAFGENITEAAQNSRKRVSKIRFDKMYFRNDIGYEFE
ncbi:MAG: phosphoribosylamine--glycine ligase [Bacteroidota bacterium]|jgi:phosphoribosylamine--glycine ligase